MINGQQVEQPKTTWGYGNDFEIDIYAAKQEDIDQVRGSDCFRKEKAE